MKNGKVHLVQILAKLPDNVTLGVIRTVVKGRVNFAPEEVDSVLAQIAAAVKSPTL